MDNSIVVKKAELLDRLAENLTKHQEKVTQAQRRYRQRLIEELERRLADAQAGRPLDVAVFARMPVPRSYAAEYEQAIQELTWHQEQTVELSSRDFARYVLDNWEWHQQFVASNSAYLDEE